MNMARCVDALRLAHPDPPDGEHHVTIAMGFACRHPVRVQHAQVLVTETLSALREAHSRGCTRIVGQLASGELGEYPPAGAVGRRSDAF